MTGDGRAIPIEVFGEIDALACGVGVVPADASRRALARQEMLAAARPISLDAASRLLARRGGRVALYTGFVVPGKYPVGENDGPLGAATLARALVRAGVHATIHADPEVSETTRWLVAELGADIPVAPLADDPQTPPEGTDAAIAIEKPGANPLGVLHTADGARIDGGSKPVDRLFAAFARVGILTIGVGDRGNEVGFGRIRERLIDLDPALGACTCGCGGGLVAATSTDILFPAAVSNWGAYALAAALALLTGDSTCALTPEEERRMLNVAAVRGCCDGIRRRGAFGIDGFAGETSVRVVAAVRDLVRRALAR